MGATFSFLPIYAARSGATPQQIGLLTALPALLTLFLALPIGRLLKQVPSKRATVLTALISRSLFLVYALLPWLAPPGKQVTAILITTVLITFPTAVIGISFSQLFMEAIPIEWRATVVGTRNAILALITFPVTLISGQILSRVAFPFGYQIVFVIGFIGGIMTVYQLWKVRPLPDLIPQPKPIIPPNTSSRLLRVTFDAQSKIYIKVIALLFLFNMINNMAAPLLPDLMVDKLNLSDAMISIGTALANVLVFGISLSVARFTMRIGNRKATACGAALFAFHAVSFALAQGAGLYLIAAVIGGISSGILGAAQYNYHLESLPDSDRSTWLAWNLGLGNAAVLLGALVGPVIARRIGVPETLFMVGVLRLLMGGLIWVRG